MSKANVNHWCQRHRWKMQKNLRFEVFFIFCWDAVGLLFTLMYSDFIFDVHFEGQVDFVASVSLPVLHGSTSDKLLPVSTTRSINTKLQISLWIFVKIRNDPSIGYSGNRGKQIREKNLNSKISCQTPFKNLLFRGNPSEEEKKRLWCDESDWIRVEKSKLHTVATPEFNTEWFWFLICT